ncbi:MAG: M14 family zinc carboxypeptidase [Candidatus Hodarchaeales archaeon]|jgi:hypothetical protein
MPFSNSNSQKFRNLNQKKIFISFSIFLLIIFSVIQSKSIVKSDISRIGTNNSFISEKEWSNISLLYPDEYHSPDELYEELQLIANSAAGIVDLFSIGKSFQNRDIYCLKITNEKLTIPKAGVLIVAHHHAREQVTIEVALRFLLRLVNNYGLDSKITEFINNEEIYIIPTLNPDGLHYVIGNGTLKGNEWLRKNLRSYNNDGDGNYDEDSPEDINGDGIISEFQEIEIASAQVVRSYLEGIDNDADGKINEDCIGGVDLNRNYAYRWNDSDTDSGWGSDPATESFPGASPFSEPETQAFRAFLENKSLATAISLHTGINATFFPWSSENYWPESSLYSKIRSDFDSVLPSHFNNLGGYQTGIGYTTAGGWGDWMYADKDCLVPMTFEIYHNGSSDGLIHIESENTTHRVERWDGMYGFFSPEEWAINSLWEDVQPMFDYWLEITPRLNFTVNSVVGGTNTGDVVSISLTIENLSPRIRTITSLIVTKENLEPIVKGGSFVNIAEIPAGTSSDVTLELELETSLDLGTNFTFLIGNEFVGYTSFTLQKEQISETQSSSTSSETSQTSQTETSQTISFDIIAILFTIPVIFIVKIILPRMKRGK